jgi:hypothetical protein
MVVPPLRETVIDPLVVPEVPVKAAIIIANDDSMSKAPINDWRRHTYWKCGPENRRAGATDAYSDREPIGARCRGRRTDSNRNQTEQ